MSRARRLVAGLGGAALIMALAVGCGSSESSSTASSSGTSSTPARTATTEQIHEINVIYDDPEDTIAATAKEILSLGGTDGVAAGFTKSFKLPTDVTIHVVNGTVGPHYTPADKTITLSYGFVDYTAGLLKKNFPELRTNDEQFGRSLAAVDGFILVHEFAHTLVDVFDLPVLGKEEDAADAIATVFMTKLVDGGDEYAFDAARFFHALSARQRKLAPADYWDSHSLDQQRAYSIVCWIAGSSEEAFNQVQQLQILGEDRLQGCPAEYQQKVEAFQGLLKPHVRQTP